MICGAFSGAHGTQASCDSPYNVGKCRPDYTGSVLMPRLAGTLSARLIWLKLRAARAGPWDFPRRP